MFEAQPAAPDMVPTRQVVVYFRTGGPKEYAYMRLVVREGESLLVEVANKDRLNQSSWRPAGNVSSDQVSRLLALAVLKSQMTPLQRIQNPRAMHPDGIVWNEGECEIALGTVKL